MKIHATFVGVGAAVALAATIASYTGPASSNEMPPSMSRSGAPMMGGRHDAAAMDQMQTIHALIVNHDSIKRTVTNLPDGIRTVTESDDPRVAQLIKEHVASMGQRVSEGSDPGLPMESSALHAIFRDKDKIHTTTETTETGIIVVQTSSDQIVVAALQQHAGEVSDLVRGGMVAMHAAMMKNGGGMMRHGMNGHFMRGGPHGMMAPSIQ